MDMHKKGEMPEKFLIKKNKSILPFFTPYDSEFFPPEGEIIEEYSIDKARVKIVKQKDLERYFYFLDPPEFHLKTSEIKNILLEFLGKKPIESEITKRYRDGLGILEIFFKDENLEDVFIDSKNPRVYVYHKKYGLMDTNIIFNEKDLKRIAIKLREISGRPFDEGIPIIHLSIGKVRVVGIRYPFSFSGIGYAFRIHEKKAWTIPKLIDKKMFDLKTGALMSLLVESFSTILITGPRGAGKTSLLSALLFEVPKTERIIIIEDTAELPISEMIRAGYRVEHVRISAWESEYEMSAEDAFRASLRLGESFLVVGEVRGPETKVLFEAMRVGAAGNTVMGTIHGASAEDVYDRIVNEIGVPPASFKATDFIISVNRLRAGSVIKKIRRLIEIKEVKKNWVKSPVLEKGFLDICKYDRKKDSWKILNLEESDAIERILFKNGWEFREFLTELDVRKKFLRACIKKKILEPVSYSKVKSLYYSLVEEGHSGVEALNLIFKSKMDVLKKLLEK